MQSVGQLYLVRYWRNKTKDDINVNNKSVFEKNRFHFTCPRYKMEFRKKLKRSRFSLLIKRPNWTVFMKSGAMSHFLFCPVCSCHLSRSGSWLLDDKLWYTETYSLYVCRVQKTFQQKPDTVLFGMCPHDSLPCGHRPVSVVLPHKHSYALFARSACHDSIMFIRPHVLQADFQGYWYFEVCTEFIVQVHFDSYRQIKATYLKLNSNFTKFIRSKKINK
jgi:hypothetical protein